MSKVVSFLVALAVSFSLATGVAYGDTVTNEVVTTTENTTEVELESLLANIDNIDIDSLDEETRQALIDKLVFDSLQSGSLVELAEQEGGVTPDSFFYFLDKLVEDIRISLALTPEDKAKILSEIALERLAEFNTLESEDKVKYVEDIINDYIDAIGQAIKAVEQAQQENPEDDVTDIISVIDEATNIGDDIINSDELTEEVLAEASNQLEKVKEVIIKAKSVAGIDKEIVTQLREQGLGYGEIKLISKIAFESKKTIEEVMAIFLETKGIGETMKIIGISPSQLNSKANKAKVEVSKEESKEIEEENDEAVEENVQTTEVSNSIEEADDDSDEVEDEEIEVKQQEVEKNAVEKQAEEARKAAEKQVEAEKKAAEKQAEAEKKAAEKQAEEMRKAAEKQAEAEKKAAEKQAEAEKRAAEKQAEAAKKDAEKQDEVSKKSEEAKENKNRNKLN